MKRLDETLKRVQGDSLVAPCRLKTNILRFNETSYKYRCSNLKFYRRIRSIGKSVDVGLHLLRKSKQNPMGCVMQLADGGAFVLQCLGDVSAFWFFSAKRKEQRNFVIMFFFVLIQSKNEEKSRLLLNTCETYV